MEYRKTSFLAEIAPETYQALSALKPVALIYLGVILLAVGLSIFFQNSVIKFFIDCMMGWTLLSIPFMGVVIVALDKEIKLPKDEIFALHSKKSGSYKLSMTWGIILVITGVIILYFSNRYKTYYAFQCQDFYLEETTGVYHIFKDCEYIGMDKDENPIDNPVIVKLTGKDLLETNYELCDACREWAEDAEAEAVSYQYRRS